MCRFSESAADEKCGLEFPPVPERQAGGKDGGSRASGQFFGLKSAAALGIHKCAFIPSDHASSLTIDPTLPCTETPGQQRRSQFRRSNPANRQNPHGNSTTPCRTTSCENRQTAHCSPNARRVKALRRDLTPVLTTACDLRTEVHQRRREAKGGRKFTPNNQPSTKSTTEVVA